SRWREAVGGTRVAAGHCAGALGRNEGRARVSSQARSALPGSASPRSPGTHVVGPVDPNKPIEVSVTVRPRQPLEDLEQRLNQVAPGEQPYLSREEFAGAYGAAAADLARVEAFAWW